MKPLQFFKFLTTIFATMTLAGTTLFAGTPNADSAEKTVVVLLRDVRQNYVDEYGEVVATAAESLAEAGLTMLQLDNFSSDDLKLLKKMSAADVADFSGADFVLVLQLAAPKKSRMKDVNYLRSTVAYNLFLSNGKSLAAGIASAINSGLDEVASPIVPATKNAMTELGEKIKSGKVSLEKSVPAPAVPAKIICQLAAPSVPAIEIDADGNVKILEKTLRPSLAGTQILLAGTTYNLTAESNAVEVEIPADRAVKISVSGNAIVPISRFVRAKNGEIHLALELNPALAQKMQNDLERVVLLRERILNDRKLTEIELSELRSMLRDWRDRWVW